ncbi:hypothetical protein, partial [Pseudomonas aeruginosa]|uniref:hypothetical protein n=1 Tax=Pseudomonas aeruginosa TaxID=287 RepID=UPI003968D407
VRPEQGRLAPKTARQQRAIEHGAFDQREGADCRAVIEGGAHHRQVLTKRLKRLGVNAAFDGRKKDLFLLQLNTYS